MDEQLRKGLEEAAEKDWKTNILRGLKTYNEEDLHLCARGCFILGGEWMFKKCGGMTVLHDMRKLILAQCEEWMRDNARNYVNGVLWTEHMMSDLETFMNKLWGGLKYD